MKTRITHFLIADYAYQTSGNGLFGTELQSTALLFNALPESGLLIPS
ncbi:hypothetical protein [Polaromonas sp.]|nr:hypothetical protein [Polaromonas sp.]NDP63332.1 hypothetical protein [Polaromonas sp.]